MGGTDPLGIAYDHVWTDSDGTRHYSRDYAVGNARGPAEWSSDHDCNPICGCHLSARCRGCEACTSCDGCYCEEGCRGCDACTSCDGCYWEED